MLPCPTIVWRRTGQARRSCPVSRRPVKLTGKSAADGVSYCPLCLNGLCVDRWPPTVESVASGDVERTWRRDGLDWYARPSRCSSRVEKLAKTASRPCNGHVPHLLQCTPPFSGVPVFGRLCNPEHCQAAQQADQACFAACFIKLQPPALTRAACAHVVTWRRRLLLPQLSHVHQPRMLI
jgi:hypothetical protein